ncbi:MAG TPA: hypothetical protein VGA56_01040 [Opitutaceae bacterium]
MRSKVGATLTVSGRPEPQRKTQAQELLARAVGNKHLEAALSLWADPMRSWPELYRILEEIERGIGKTVDAVGYCSGNARQRFRRTANSATSAGWDARHAFGLVSPPSNPMTRDEAERFIAQLLLSALR